MPCDRERCPGRKECIRRAGDAVDLRGRADAENADRRAGDGKRHGKPAEAVAQPLINITERPAEPSVRFLSSVFDREKALCVLRRHAEDRRDQHPQERARSSRRQSGRDADDVSRADRRRKGGAQRGVGTDPVRLFLRPDQPQRLPQPAELHAFQPHGEEQADAEEQEHHRPAPYPLPDLPQNPFHVSPPIRDYSRISPVSFAILYFF